MMTAVNIPNLPQNSIKMAVCGEFAPMLDALRSRGVEVVEVSPSPLLPAPIAHHADILCCHAAQNTLVTFDDSLGKRLSDYAVNVILAAEQPGKSYPDDCRLNCLVLGNIAVGRVDSLDAALRGVLASRGVKIFDTSQGYARCSIALVDEHSLITADRGLERLLTAVGFDVLLISPGGIILEGYDTGFIGGCCGKLSADTMLFCGDVMTHPDGGRIVEFLGSRGVKAECSHCGSLTDFGGFIGLCE